MTTAGASLAAASAHAGEAPKIFNPLVLQRADPQIYKHTDGYYYLLATAPEFDRLVGRRAKTLAGLATAEEVLLWNRPTEGKMGGYIWAPEIHHFDGQWHIYFGAGDKGDVFRVRTYVLTNSDANPLNTNWSLLGQVETPWDTFTLDATLFEHSGTRYLCWAQGEPGIHTNSNIYLAPMASPLKLAAAPARLTVPTLGWEIIGYKVNEGPAFLVHKGRIFLTYSASATDENYCLGMLTASEDADLMDPASWTKSPVPVFKSSAANNVWGPGHNSFTVDEQGRDILVYHARDYQKIEGNPLHDPNRHTRLQVVQYRPDGTPDFGEPVKNGLLR
ncbi:glycoside hydrolase family 43 protein [Asticcacaulis biprosthecium]|nr:glycoside hydrolase family 43 protein [Asticcacaulis biprosthecium]